MTVARAAEMRPVTRADDDLFQAVCLAAKLGKATAIVERLAVGYAEARDDPEAGFRYALAMTALLHQSSGSDIERHAGYNEVMDALGDVIHAAPDHWLGRYFRVRLRAMIPTTYSVYQTFVVAERGRVVPDVNELIERQERAGWQPHFACAYLLAAHIVLDGDRDLGRINELISAAVAGERRPLPFPALGAILCEPFVAVYNEPAAPQRELIGQLMSVLFPAQPMVLSALHEYRGR